MAGVGALALLALLLGLLVLRRLFVLVVLGIVWLTDAAGTSVDVGIGVAVLVDVGVGVAVGGSVTYVRKATSSCVWAVRATRPRQRE